MKIFKVLIVIAYFFTLLSNAQKTEYLVLENNDTIYGEKLIFNRKGIVVKNGKNKTIFNVSVIKGYYQNKRKRYNEKVLSPFPWDSPGDKTFLTRLSNEGIIKLYIEYGNSQFPSRYWISKNNSNLKFLTGGWGKFGTKDTYSILKEYFSDKNEINEKLETIVLKQKSLIELINEYNDKTIK